MIQELEGIDSQISGRPPGFDADFGINIQLCSDQACRGRQGYIARPGALVLIIRFPPLGTGMAVEDTVKPECWCVLDGVEIRSRVAPRLGVGGVELIVDRDESPGMVLKQAVDLRTGGRAAPSTRLGEVLSDDIPFGGLQGNAGAEAADNGENKNLSA